MITFLIGACTAALGALIPAIGVPLMAIIVVIIGYVFYPWG